MHACTIVARNYLAFARVLAESFLSIHPDSSFTTLVVDAEFGFDSAGEPFNVVTPAQLDLSDEEFHRMAVMYDVTELSTALKPWTLRYLIENGADAALYIDPDIQLFSPIDDVADIVAAHGVALTPHTLQPMPRDNRLPSEADIMGSGVYNLGFIGVGPSAIPFLRWWEERLMRDAISAPEQMLFTDQRWVDFVPSYFDHHIIRDPGFNVAYWNLDARKVTKEDGRFLVNGHPLRFFHFSGYRPETPWILSKYVASSPRVLLSEQPVLLELCEGYSASLGSAAFDHAAATPYGFNFLADGTAVTTRMRRIYREAVLAHEQGSSPAPPTVFGPHSDGGLAFVEWLNEPVDGPAHSPISRFMAHIWASRDDLQWAYRDPAGAGFEGFSEWMHDRAAFEESVPAALIPGRTGPTKQGQLAKPTPGVNIVGYFRAELGVGQIGRFMIDAVKDIELPYSVHTNAKTLSRQQHPLDEQDSDQFPHSVNIVVVNADQTAVFQRDQPVDIRKDRYTIGVWAWEVDELSPVFAEAFTKVDEVWAISRFIQQALVKHSPVPVHVFPSPVVAPVIDPTITRESLGVPEGFVFLFAFDYLSVLKRKNPIGLIQAFCAAFAPGEGPTLVIKSINGDRCLSDRERVRFAAAARPDIVLIEDYLSVDQTRALTALSDCYVSLHRSEGLGLTMAEAMSLGKPVIATGYSGNLDFMDDKTTYLVPYELVPVGKDAAPYSPTARWAEPDLVAAAGYMREIFDDPEAAARKGLEAQRGVLENRSLRHTSLYVESRVKFAEEVLAGERDLPAFEDDVDSEVEVVAQGPDLYEVFKDRAERTYRQIESVPDPAGPSRIPVLVPLLRKLVNRARNQHDAHDRESFAQLLETVRALSAHNQAWFAHLEQLVEDQRVRNDGLKNYVDIHVVAMHDDVRQIRIKNRAIDSRLSELTSRAEQLASALSLPLAPGEVPPLAQAVADLQTARAELAAFRAETETMAATLSAAVELLGGLSVTGDGGSPLQLLRTDAGILFAPADRPARSYGAREQDQVRFLSSALADGDTFLDIGAGLGYHTIAAAKVVGPRGRVIAVEPSEGLVAVLRRNIEANLPASAQVIVQPVAPWDEDAPLTFAPDGPSARAYPAALDRSGTMVDGRRLDTLEALEDTTVAVVRTDLRGRDHRALRGLRKTIERDRPVIVTELWPEGIRDVGDDPVAVLAEYADMGYAVASLPGQPQLLGDGATIVTLAESAPGGSLTLALTTTASL
ncbi:FkbM family methyltransferase [Acidothermaceae bacterium B102]|nr:FkbM family methyltransferase [Acidothermaceae bacterium B102]